MKMSGTTRLEIAPAEVWAKLSDPRTLGEALPAVERLEVEADGSFEAGFRPSTGLGTTPMTIEFELAERDDPRRLVVRGVGGGVDYAVRLEAAFDLVAAGDGTDVLWNLDLHLHGALHSLTQRVIEQLAGRQVAAVLAAVGAPAAPVSG